MPLISQIQEQHPLAAVVQYGEIEFNFKFYPSKLSKPFLKKIQEFAAMEDWEDKADSASMFLTPVIGWWDWVKEDPEDPTKPLLIDGREVMVPITYENVEILGFAAQKAISKALNARYAEFMQEGEDSSASSEDQSQVPANVTSIGTQLSSPQETTSTADLGN